MPQWLDATLAVIGIVLGAGALVLRATRHTRDGVALPAIVLGVSLLVVAGVIVLSRRFGSPRSDP